MIKRFGIPDIKEILLAPNVLVRGLLTAEQAAWLEKIAARQLLFQEQTDTFKQVPTWKIVAE